MTLKKKVNLDCFLQGSKRNFTLENAAEVRYVLPSSVIYRDRTNEPTFHNTIQLLSSISKQVHYVSFNRTRHARGEMLDSKQ